jgi:hypothetical protein
MTPQRACGRTRRVVPDIAGPRTRMCRRVRPVIIPLGFQRFTTLKDHSFKRSRPSSARDPVPSRAGRYRRPPETPGRSLTAFHRSTPAFRASRGRASAWALPAAAGAIARRPPVRPESGDRPAAPRQGQVFGLVIESGLAPVPECGCAPYCPPFCTYDLTNSSAFSSRTSSISSRIASTSSESLS